VPLSQTMKAAFNGHAQSPERWHDALVKEAAGKSKTSSRPTRPSHLRRVARETMIREWQMTWEARNKGRNYSGTFKKKPDQLFPKIRLCRHPIMDRSRVLELVSSRHPQRRSRQPVSYAAAEGKVDLETWKIRWWRKSTKKLASGSVARRRGHADKQAFIPLRSRSTGS
jgi:hypothetical protein